MHRFTLCLFVFLALCASSASLTTHAQVPGRPQFGLPPLTSQGERAAPFNDSRDQVSVRAVASAQAVLVGGDLAVAIVLEMQPGWHVWPNRVSALPGVANFDRAILTAVTPVELPEGFQLHAGFTQWPQPHRFTMFGEEYAVFEGTAPIFLPLVVQPDAKPGDVRLLFQVHFQACDDKSCLKEAAVEVPVDIRIIAVGDPLTGASAVADPIFQQFDPSVFARIRSGETAPNIVPFNVFGWEFEIDARGAGYVLLLLVAAVGGFLLNLTPCVLPVIPLKIMGLVEAGGSRGRTFILGLAMCAGVMAFWMAIGLATTTITGFTSVNQLFQYPFFTIGVGLFIAVMAVGMLGFFSVGLPQWVYLINPKQTSIPGSIGFGVMTAILSTPCTAPLMGSAVAWATKQPSETVLAVFAAVGAGMALPYVILAAFPHLAHKMPRSGPASEVIKQVMGLLLLAAALYFVGAGLSGMLVSPPDPPTRLYWWAVAGASFLAGVWLLIRTLQLATKGGTRFFFGGVGLFIMCMAGLVGFTQTAKGPITWTYYTQARFDEAIDRGDVVVVTFTAEWCLTCKVLESTVLNSPDVAAALNGEGVAPIKVDITGNNPEGNARLKNAGSVTIPFLVVYAPNGNAVFRSEAYGPQQVLDAIAEARGERRVSGGTLRVGGK